MGHQLTNGSLQVHFRGSMRPAYITRLESDDKVSPEVNAVLIHA